VGVGRGTVGVGCGVRVGAAVLVGEAVLPGGGVFPPEVVVGVVLVVLLWLTVEVAGGWALANCGVGFLPAVASTSSTLTPPTSTMPQVATAILDLIGNSGAVCRLLYPPNTLHHNIVGR
jgi:hypothetical protein